ncbi:MAG: Uncharacterised protein [Flavobacteriaceae bacterium]|nr:MAG: Uncharacterised protein [Flavobacteriaceae bacterium]|tara:strand:- start:98 stop:487 length:390 start_codon:yes stop_codon:yes gene_type:complete
MESVLSSFSIPYSLGALLVALLGMFLLFGPYARWKQQQLQKKDSAYAQSKGWSYERLQEERNKKRSRTISSRLRKMILERDNHQCQQCGSRTDLTIDHIFPFSRGGGKEPNNLQLLCHRCNAKKSDAIL